MSQSRVASVPEHSIDPSAEHVRRVDDAATIQKLLDALDDADCRAILDATSDDQLTAKEVSETCGLPLSTTYRKLEVLADAGLLEDRTRIRRSGKHTSEYARLFESVVLSLDSDGHVELLVSSREQTSDDDVDVDRQDD